MFFITQDVSTLKYQENFPYTGATWVSIYRITTVMITTLGRFKFNNLIENVMKTKHKSCAKKPHPDVKGHLL